MVQRRVFPVDQGRNTMTSRHQRVAGLLRTRAAVALCPILLGAGLLCAVGSSTVGAHGKEARYLVPVPWTKPHFARVIASWYTALGLEVYRGELRMETIGARSCAVSSMLVFDVDDSYAFDVDEPVALTLTYAPRLTTAPFVVMWDQNGGEGRGIADISPEPAPNLRTVTVTLDRARLAGQGTLRADIAIGSRRGDVALCDIAIARSGTSKPPAVFGRLRLDVKDGRSGQIVPARVGLYDATGRAPLPSDQALLVDRFADEVRQLWATPRDFWVSRNRQVFYVNGTYEANVPAGTYDLVVTRGPEYRAHMSKVEVVPNNSAAVTVTLDRYADLPARGWYSGDGHIHLLREPGHDANVLAQIAAEDIHVGNLLQMGNIAGTHFEASSWGSAGRVERDGHLVVPGQEDPRTIHRGHTIHHNLQRAIHLDPTRYFFYHEVFEEAHRQGGVSGYSHLAPWYNPARGLALDVPFGLVDFVEVLQQGRLNTDIWYSFLNLGYRLLPLAGSDYPYLDLPGAVRNYAKIDGPFSADAWFAAFRRGETYVTNGPFLEMSVNGRPMGTEIPVARGSTVDIVAEASMSPDVDHLGRLEILVYGRPIAVETARGRDRVRLRARLTADRSMWVAVRAQGERQAPDNAVVAHSAPTYLIVDGEPSWKVEDVPSLAQRHRKALRDLMSEPIEPLRDLEPWLTETLLVEQWEKQRPLLKARVDEADAKYQELAARATESLRRTSSRR
jgi:hypothetical protein